MAGGGGGGDEGEEEGEEGEEMSGGRGKEEGFALE